MVFARDNTNDGGGWNVRFHHFTGGEDHGYPRLYKNFADEAVKPLADYGGGSGCGAAWVSEPAGRRRGITGRSPSTGAASSLPRMRCGPAAPPLSSRRRP